MSVVNFDLHYNFWTTRDRDFMLIYISFIYSTKDALSSETKVNDIVTLTLTSVLNVAFSDSVVAGDIHALQTHLVEM